MGVTTQPNLSSPSHEMKKKIIFKHQVIDKAKRLIYLEAVSERGSMIQCMLEHQRKDHENQLLSF